MGIGTGAGYAKVLGPLDATIAAKLAKYHMGKPPGREKREREAGEQVNNDRDKFAVNKELLHNGQPNIRETGDAVTGDLRRIMRRDSKQRC